MLDVTSLNFEKGNGLVLVVTQDAHSDEVLMVAYADKEAVERTLATGEMHYRSRTRGLWHKGATSGNVQRVVSLEKDCDGDAILAKVEPAGPACHTGARSCFVSVGDAGAPNENSGTTRDALSQLAQTLALRAKEKQAGDTGTSSYTRRLLSDRNLRLKKLGEEMAELVTACADADTPRAVEECADVFYHALVALQALGATLEDVKQVLHRRAQPAKARGTHGRHDDS